jgi:uncharacterized coiled-coil DUF342 family protein
MVRFLTTAFALFTSLGLLAGCAKQEDLLVRKKIELYEKMAELYEDVTDRGSFDDAQEKMKPIQEELAKIEPQINSHPAKVQALATHKDQYDAAMKRFGDAKRNAAIKGLGQ